ncbi:MAG: 3-carboxy-cis,cis-muconate cycloisomerase [Actinomycetota bacterium]|jgi:3-carboxy-cis,cis-muconate cycloisomerase|nr:3-carboxy-cis,cis-muconate cycloisomerase [Actinomycetota bacterium]
MSEELFAPIFIPDELRESTGGRAWLQSMLDAEAALARAESKVGLFSTDDAETIAAHCDASRFDVEGIGHAGRGSGSPVPPMVKALTESVRETSKEAARHVHKGATSQDILDTAAMLVFRRTTDIMLDGLDALAAACARLADGHRSTVMAGRTLMQQALPTTFGLKAAGWLVAVVEARHRLVYARAGLTAQLGGAAGTLASLGDDGLDVLREYANELGLAEPVVPWHTSRARVADLGNVLSTVAGVAGKVALDIVLMSQTEVGEVSEPSGDGRGGSSTLPHKRNPVLSTVAIANARRVHSLASTLHSAMFHEHERAAGAWHSEWEALSDALALSGGAVSAVREAVEGLEVHTEKMRRNLEITGGLLLAENVTTKAAERLGRMKAHELVEAAARRTMDNGTGFREELLADGELREALSEEEMDDALEPENYLGSSGEFIERALELCETEGISWKR